MLSIEINGNPNFTVISTFYMDHVKERCLYLVTFRSLRQGVGVNEYQIIL